MPFDVYELILIPSSFFLLYQLILDQNIYYQLYFNFKTKLHCLIESSLLKTRKRLRTQTSSHRDNTSVFHNRLATAKDLQSRTV